MTGPFYLSDNPGSFSDFADGTPNIKVASLAIFKVAGFVTGVKWRAHASDSGAVVLEVWRATTAGGSGGGQVVGGTRLGMKSTTTYTTGAYNVTLFDDAVAVAVDEAYIFTRYSSAGRYSEAGGFLSSPRGGYTALDPILLPANGTNLAALGVGPVGGFTGIANGVFNIGGGADGFPSTAAGGNYYGVSPEFYTVLPGTPEFGVPPRIVSQSDNSRITANTRHGRIGSQTRGGRQ